MTTAKEKHWASYGVPARYANVVRTDFETWPEMNDSGIHLAGKVGRGKTHMATGIFMRAVWEGNKQKATGRWVSCLQLLTELRASFSSKNRTELQVIQEYVSPQVLLLDDFMAERQSDYSLSSLYLILSRRINELKLTIVTTNDMLKDIARAEPRIASRLNAMAYICLEGPDRRVKK